MIAAVRCWPIFGWKPPGPVPGEAVVGQVAGICREQKRVKPQRRLPTMGLRAQRRRLPVLCRGEHHLRRAIDVGVDLLQGETVHQRVHRLGKLGHRIGERIHETEQVEEAIALEKTVVVGHVQRAVKAPGIARRHPCPSRTSPPRSHRRGALWRVLPPRGSRCADARPDRAGALSQSTRSPPANGTSPNRRETPRSGSRG